jgi:peptide/nickel transport system substrate-binding protein
VPEGSVRADGVGTGEYHFADSLDPDRYDVVKGQANVTPIIVKPYYWTVWHFNKKNSPFKELKLRQAALAAMSMDPIAKASIGRNDFYRLGPEIAAPETGWYNDEGKDVYNKPDPDRAKALVKEGGYDGTPIRIISTKEYFYNYNAALPLKQQLEEVGFKVDLQVMDWATLVKRRSDPNEYDIFGTAHNSYDHPVLQPYLSPTWPGFWENEERDKLVGQIFAEPDPQKMNAIIKQLQALQWREVPGIKICEYFLLQSRSNKLMGYGAPVDWFFWNAWLA